MSIPSTKRRRRFGLLILTAIVGLASFAVTSAVAAGPVAPASDPFYTYSGSLRSIPPGTVLRTRRVQISAGSASAAVTGTQILYRTQNQLGEPSATVATIIRPAAATGPTKLVSYQTFYDGVASTCRPSYTLQGGDPSNATAAYDSSFLLDYVAQGYTVVTADYEGPTDDYGAGRESGYGTLDAIRAAEHRLRLAAKTTPVGLVGYSGGATATEWASELQPSYAPKLDIVGVAEAGIPVDFTHNTEYIDGSKDWAGAIPAVSIGLDRAYHLNLATYSSPLGTQIASQVKQGCLNPSAYPGLRFSDLLKPQYKHWQKVPIFVRIFNDTIMSTAGTPKGPLLMGVGDSDGTGDGVMVTKDVQQLAHIYCTRHVSVRLHIYHGLDHVQAIPGFETQALQFLTQRLSGHNVPDDCASIKPGDPLTPLPRPKTATRMSQINADAGHAHAR